MNTLPNPSSTTPAWLHALTTLLTRWTPLLALVGCLATILFVPLAIVSHGYTPEDDVLSDAALAVSGRTWGDVMLIGPAFDQELRAHAGWESLLRSLHRVGFTQDQLAAGVIAGLAFLAFLPAVILLRRPECALLLLGVLVVVDFNVFMRFLSGRPYLLDVCCTCTFLLLWRRFERNPLHPGLIALFALMLILRVWIRGNLATLGIPLVAFYASAWLSGRYRPALVFTACVAVGIIGGGLLYGNPLDFIVYNAKHLYWTLFRPSEFKSLATEMLPLTGNVQIFLFAATFVVASLSRTGDPERFRHPAFILALMGWMMSFTVVRFWFDFGLPAFLVWAALELENHLETHMRRDGRARLLLAAFAAGSFALALLMPHRDKWRESPIVRAAPVRALAIVAPDWLPGAGGIVYNPTMKIFYTFFALFPHGPWKYATGTEPGLMPPEDLRVYDAINRTGSADAYRPWVAKLRPVDRMVLKLPPDHAIRTIFPELEWRFVPPDYWFGRTRNTAPPQVPAP